MERARLTERLGDGIMPSTVNNELRVLGTALRWARRQGYRVSVPRVRRLRELRPRVRAWSTDELLRLYAAVQAVAPHLLPPVVLMANTGLRRGEAMRADWSWLSADGTTLTVPVLRSWRPKSGRARDVPVPPAALALLGPRPPVDAPLCPRLDGERYRVWPKQLWARAVSRAGLSGGAHQLRHSYASHFLARQPDLWLLARVLGHSHTRTTQLYAHLLPEHLALAHGAVDIAPPRKTMAGRHGGQKRQSAKSAEAQ